MTDVIEQPPSVLNASPGDVLFSRMRIPYPGLILQGFSRRHRYGPEIEPFISFKQLQYFLEFLEFVVLTERLIVPVPQFSKQTQKIVNSKRHWVDFAIFQATGDLSLDTECVVEKLTRAGVLFECGIAVGDPTADDVAARLLPTSRSLQSQFSTFLRRATAAGISDPFAYATASIAFWSGAPLHVAEAAGLAKVPYVLGHHEELHLQGFESENLKTRKSVAELMLDRLNSGARKELAQIAQLGVLTTFPETPIASLILQRATSPVGLLDAAIELRAEFTSYRRHMNQIEHDLANESQSLKIRLKRAKELEQLASSLWAGSKTDLKASAIGVSEALFALPEIVADPTASTLKGLATKIAALPVDAVLNLYRKRKIRLLLKAKRSFLRGSDQTANIARVLNVEPKLVALSRTLAQPRLTAKYAAKHPEEAAAWYGTQQETSQAQPINPPDATR
ncbi:MAG: hypothetical protein M0P95_13225 [Sulfuritalea sp.]|jgi:hypothetical protein|nr:hypothetical protein [Sulfuritalea sp.]